MFITSYLKKFFFNNFSPIILGCIIALILKMFIIQTNIVSGPSMLPTLQNGDFLISDKLTYHFHQPEKGDIVIVHLKTQLEDKLIIKRVIGLPGDVLYFETPSKQNGNHAQFYINNKLQKEPYIKETMDIPQNIGYKVKPGEIFVLGDNRNVSADSRYFGPFKFSDVESKVVLEVSDKFQFHTKPGVYIIIISLLFLSMLVYLFYPTKRKEKASE